MLRKVCRCCMLRRLMLQWGCRRRRLHCDTQAAVCVCVWGGGGLQAKEAALRHASVGVAKEAGAAACYGGCMLRWGCR
jgi:hypothetical protein